MSAVEKEKCHLCQVNEFKYVCPKCNVPYCSVECYKSQRHLKCSEEFYKKCIQDELVGGEKSTKDVRKIYDILKRMHAADAGEDLEFSDAESIDSDDDAPEEEADDEEDELANEDEDEEAETDIALRLQNIDINDSDAVWERLTSSERKDFQKMINNGEIMKLLPDFTPWWQNSKHQQKAKIVDLSKKQEDENIPKIIENIPEFSSICKKPPSPCVHNNLWNILASYACTVRFYNGEHLATPSAAAAELCDLSTTLKYGTNFEDADEAILSVEMEALTSGNGVKDITTAKAMGANVGAAGSTLLVESREQLERDVQQLMSCRQYKLAALSDILNMLQLTRKQMKTAESKDMDFQKLSSLSTGSVQLDRKKLLQICKKIEFSLSYVNINNIT